MNQSNKNKQMITTMWTYKINIKNKTNKYKTNKNNEIITIHQENEPNHTMIETLCNIQIKTCKHQTKNKRWINKELLNVNK